MEESICCRYEGERGRERNLDIFGDTNISTIISTKRCRRERSVDVVMQRGIFENNQITLVPCFTFIPKQRLVFIV